ncbi:hypothetical protein E2C01_032873 [Portunus trituberculatus]|uniref:Uncharacterized protein n=1 Tax=Portunus trituberculatus TaxID=210409 RepID=A0A5B7EWD1_PORTR|nr:hypothetical protein [Portunus trituberculatus]
MFIYIRAQTQLHHLRGRATVALRQRHGAHLITATNTPPRRGSGQSTPRQTWSGGSHGGRGRGSRDCCTRSSKSTLMRSSGVWVGGGPWWRARSGGLLHHTSTRVSVPSSTLTPIAVSNYQSTFASSSEHCVALREASKLDDDISAALSSALSHAVSSFNSRLTDVEFFFYNIGYLHLTFSQFSPASSGMPTMRRLLRRLWSSR